LFIICDWTVVASAAFQAVRQQPVNFVNSLKAGLPRVIPVMLIEIITALLAGLAMLVPAVILGSMWLGAAAVLKRDEFRFAPPLNQSPLVPAKAGIQGLRTRPKCWVPASAGTNGI
jgi:hypothetical protein